MASVPATTGQTVIPAVSVDELGLVSLDEVQELLALNVGTAQLNTFDLPRLPMPTQGNTTWTLQTPEGEKTTPSFEGVVALVKPGRVYYDTPFTGEIQPPTCRSGDLVNGSGNPGGLCRRCPLSQWGSDPKGGQGQACAERKFLFVMLPGMNLPFLLQIPRTSVPAWNNYGMYLTSRGLPYYAVVTRFGLSKSKSGTFTITVLAPEIAAVVPKEERATLRELNKSLAAMFEEVDIADLVAQENGNGAPVVVEDGTTEIKF